MYKIYINDYPLVLTGAEGGMTSQEERVLGITYLGQPKQLLQCIDKLEKSPDPPLIVIRSDEPQKMKSDFWNLFKIVKAAGGLVYNAQGEVLFIKRLGFWDLPKGKRDKGEKNKTTALREVAEEVGLKCTIEARLPKTYHTYRLSSGKRVLKPTAWYKLHHTFGEVILQTSESITDHQWIQPGDALVQLRPMYRSLQDLLQGLNR